MRASQALARVSLLPRRDDRAHCHSAGTWCLFRHDSRSNRGSRDNNSRGAANVEWKSAESSVEAPERALRNASCGAARLQQRSGKAVVIAAPVGAQSNVIRAPTWVHAP